PGWGATLRLRVHRISSRDLRGLGKNPRADRVVAAATDMAIIDTDDGVREVGLGELADLMGIPGANPATVIMKICGGDAPRVNTLLGDIWEWRTGQTVTIENQLGE
ncbi:MAG: hypothetical protein KDA45_05390, partial [Planctomycetales bacterium]|nr:hypothetical protein [Planctomycetales bacterium]